MSRGGSVTCDQPVQSASYAQPARHVHSYAPTSYAPTSYAPTSYAPTSQPARHVHSYGRRPATVRYADIFRSNVVQQDVVQQDDVQQYIQTKSVVYKAIANDGSEWTNTNRERLEADVKLINEALAQAGERVPITITVPK